MKTSRFLVPATDPILKAVAAPVEPGERIDAIMDKMLRVCKHDRGVGIAAPQIGVSKRIILVMADSRPLFMINPEIELKGGLLELYNEGCLTFPGKFKVIARDSMVVVNYLDASRIPRKRNVFQDMKARVIQHEIDHLNGICRVGDDSPADGVDPDTFAATPARGEMATVVAALTYAAGGL